MSDLPELRERIRDVDRRLVDLAAERMDLARAVGELKRQRGVPIRDYAVEADVIRLVRERAIETGVRGEVVEDLVKMLIRESLRVQEQDRARRGAAESPHGERALVIGGAGRMGAWFVEFLASKGYHVDVADPRAGDAGVTDVTAAAAESALVLVAAPPSATARELDRLDGRTGGLVFDISSIKGPVLPALERLRDKGASVSSLHPMWGPTADLLAEKNVLVCSLGDKEADAWLAGLFADTAAHVVHMSVRDHDALVAHTLGLPHMVNLATASALEATGETFEHLDSLGGPTFRKQARVTREVTGENKDLYYEIQRLNPHTPQVLSRLRQSLDELEASLEDRDAFRAFMARGQAWFGGKDETP